MNWFEYEAFEAGLSYAREVKRGNFTPEQAGDAWQRYADRSHEGGVAFLAAYDRLGAPR